MARTHTDSHGNITHPAYIRNTAERYNNRHAIQSDPQVAYEFDPRQLMEEEEDPFEKYGRAFESLEAGARLGQERDEKRAYVPPPEYQAPQQVRTPITTSAATQDRVADAADAYRNASPEDRAALMQDYADALEMKAREGRVQGGAPAGRSRPTVETGARSAADAFGILDRNEAFRKANNIVEPDTSDRYNNFLADQFIDPDSIGSGGAYIDRGSGKMVVPGRGARDLAYKMVNLDTAEEGDIMQGIRNAQLAGDNATATYLSNVIRSGNVQRGTSFEDRYKHYMDVANQRKTANPNGFYR